MDRVFERYWMEVSAALGLQALVWVHLGRQKWAAVQSRSWLSTLPVSRRKTLLRIAVHACAGPSLVLVTFLLAALVARLLEVRGAWRFGSAATLATVAGAALGWWLPHKAKSKSVSRIGGSKRSSCATLAALSRWPATQVRVWLQPRAVARLLVPAMLSLPLGTSGAIGIAVLGVWIAVWHVALLMRATVIAAREATDWLRPTPLRLTHLLRVMIFRSAVTQILWLLTAFGLVLLLRERPT